MISETEDKQNQQSIVTIASRVAEKLNRGRKASSRFQSAEVTKVGQARKKLSGAEVGENWFVLL